MVKKKENINTEELVTNDFDEEPVTNDFDDQEESEVIDSSLEIGGQIHTQGQIITDSSPHLPKDTKYSNFGSMDVNNYILKSKTYQLWKYIRKIQNISKIELNKIKLLKKEIYNIKTPLDLKNHLEKIGKGYIWYSFLQLPKEDFEKYFKSMQNQLMEAKNEGIIEILYADKTLFYTSYNEYTAENIQHRDVDDFGLMNGMLTLTEVKKAKDGWGMGMMNTTINITKEENLEQENIENAEEKEINPTGILNRFKK